MKKTFLIVSLIVAAPLSAGWEPCESTCTANNLNAVHFFDTDLGWVVGDVGTICNTTDGGSTWRSQQEGPYPYNLNDVLFVTDRTGWAVGSSGRILGTADGGAMWAEKTISLYDLHAVHFVDSTFGVIAGASGVLLFTADGGQNWSDTLISRSSLYDVYFHNRQIGWCVGQDVICHTTDGGANWDCFAPGYTLYALSFPDSLHGWVSGTAGVVCHTTDGGEDWDCAQRTTSTLFGAHFCDTLEGWAVGQNGTILHTEDGGVVWDLLASGLYALNDVFSVSCEEGWACGDGGTILIRTTGLQEALVIENAPEFRSFPNPSTDYTIFCLPWSGPLRIFDSSGRLVREFPAGRQLRILWDGRDSSGESVPAGAYFYRFERSDVTISGKLVRLHSRD